MYAGLWGNTICTGNALTWFAVVDIACGMHALDDQTADRLKEAGTFEAGMS